MQVAEPDHRLRNFMGLLSLRASAVSFIAFVCLALIGFEIVSLLQGREHEIRHAERTTENLARSVAQQAEDGILAVDTVLSDLVEHIQANGNSPAALQALLRLFETQVEILPGLLEITYLDGNGNSVANSLANRSRLNFADQDYFAAHRDQDGGLHIGPPVHSETRNIWMIPLSRRVSGRDGSFAGVVVAMLDTARFQAFYETFDIGAEGVVILATAEGMLLVRRPFDDANFGRDITAAPMFQSLAAQPFGTAEVHSPTDGIWRIRSYRKLERYPLIVAVALGRDEVLAEWHSEAWQQGLIAVLLSAFAGLLGWRLTQQIDLRQRAEREAAAAAERYRRLADHSSEMIFTFDLDLVRRYVSPAVYDLFGYTPEEWIGLKAGHTVHPEDVPRTKAIWRMMTQGLERAVLENRLQHRDGHWVWIESNMRLIRDPVTGEPKEIFGTARDISDRKDAEEALQNARKDAEQATKAKSDFLAAMSHGLHTPMQGLLGVARQLDRGEFGPLTARQKDAVEAILDNGKHVQHLIDDTVAFSRSGSGMISVHVEAVEILPLMKSVIAALKADAQAGGIALTIGDGGAGLPKIRADRTRLAQALINFGSNAIKYNRAQGSVRLGCEDLGDGWARFTVTDTGIGIPEDRQADLFRAANDQALTHYGTIGLPLTRRLVELMGGRIGFASRLGEGSRFWIDMPFDPASLTAALPAPPPVQRPAPPPVRTILYVGQNRDELLLMRHVAASLPQVQLIEASDGAIGLAMAALRRPGVVLIDAELPDIAGLDFLGQLKKMPDMADTPVLALSGGEAQRSLQAGFFRYLPRPLDIPALLAGLDAALAAAGGDRDSAIGNAA